MPRALDVAHLTTSEENALNTRGFVLSAKLGEGAYAKVLVFLFYELHFQVSRFATRYT